MNNDYEIRAIKDLYSRYGFTIEKSYDENVLVFAFEDGYFQNIEIIMFGDASADETFKKYTEVGYSCKRTKYENIDAVNEKLFNGFFSVRSNASRIKRRYESFCEEQSKFLNSKYSYITCPYTLEVESGVDKGLLAEKGIVELVSSLVSRPNSCLVIIEAAAGFGKTCTSQEIVNNLVSIDSPKNPIFTELSRNRTARIFRYVLLDEIDRNYSKLDSETVKYEIESGRIPVFIDGFDELISKSTSDKSEGSTEDAESMLDTIGDLLKGQAKIVITSRKTAFFSGEKFENWISSRASEFEYVRISIKEPSLTDWLGKDRISLLNENRVPVNKILNPVLLTYLKNLSEEEFRECSENIESIIFTYFNSILNREKERQNLKLDKSEQLSIFKELAFSMVNNDISSDEKEMIQYLIAEDSATVIDSSLGRYGISEKPSFDELTEKLTNHALLDRVGRSDYNVGFVNDFVFGTLLGERILENELEEEWICSENFLDLVVTAFKFRDDEKKKELWAKIKGVVNYYDESLKFSFELSLKNKIETNFKGTLLEELSIKDSVVGGPGLLNGCVFSSSKFDKVKFDGNFLRDVVFIGCEFESCEFIERDLSQHHFFNCRYINNERFDDSIDEKECETDDTNEVESQILNKLWPQGNQHAYKYWPVKRVMSGLSEYDYKEICSALGSLENQGLIKINKNMIFLSFNKIGLLKKILGR